MKINWTNEELSQKMRTKHVNGLHPFLGKFIPQLAEQCLKTYFKKGDHILDPFCGSGTTLVQAKEMGINSIGCDISEFNCMLSRVKLGIYNINILKEQTKDILERTENNIKRNFRIWVTDEPSQSLSEYINKWFAPQSIYELLTYKEWIKNGPYNYLEVFKIILSRSARTARLVKHINCDEHRYVQKESYDCVRHGRTCTPPSSAFKYLKNYSHDTLKKIEEYSKLQKDVYSVIFHGDSRELKIPQIDGIVTSPPYVGLIDYHHQHEYAYQLLDLKDRRELEIGKKSGGVSKNAIEEYRVGIVDVFKNILPSIRRDGYIVIIVNDNKYDLYPSICNELDLREESVYKRKVINRTRKINDDTYSESIFIWRKK